MAGFAERQYPINMTNKVLWAPWRMAYIDQLSDRPAEGDRGCFLCEAAAQPAPGPGGPVCPECPVLLSDSRGLLVLNAFPYTSGHLLAAPREHVADLLEMTPAQRADLFELVALAERLIKTAYNPQGVNIGVNLGRCAGAGLPGHLHVHIVPRWAGDTNFMHVVAGVRMIPQALEESYRQLAAALSKL